MDAAKIRNAAQLCLAMGAIDLDASLHYTSAHRWFAQAGVSLDLCDYDKLEQALRNVMTEREGDGCMIWEVSIDKYAAEYERLLKGADDGTETGKTSND